MEFLIILEKSVIDLSYLEKNRKNCYVYDGFYGKFLYQNCPGVLSNKLV